MSFLHVFILSVVEGLTEFLPISSTGHLILASKMLGIRPSEFQKTFEIVIQLGAILAVVFLYLRRFFTDRDLIKKLLAAFVPTAIVGFTFYPLIKGFLLGSSAVTLNALFWGGAALIGIEWLLKGKNETKPAGKITYRQAIVIGTFQSLSVVPGVSRAAATIIGGLLTGLDRSTATEFSFLLAVPTMIAATGLDLYKSRDFISGSGILTLLAGTALSFIFAVMAIRFLIGYVKKHDFTAFGIYRIILAILFWVFVR